MTVALVETAALRVRQSPLVPALGRPERVLDRVLSGWGSPARRGLRRLAAPLAAPAHPVAAGHRLGRHRRGGLRAGSRRGGTVALPRDPGPHRSPARRRARGARRPRPVGGAVDRVAPRRLAERDPPDLRDGADVTPHLAGRHHGDPARRDAAAAGRTGRAPPRSHGGDLAGTRLPHRLSIVLGTGLVVALFWGLWTGVIVNGFFAGANAIFAPRDTTGSMSTNRPTAPERSGSPQSLAAWEDLGYYGRLFVRGGPSAQRIEAVTGRPGAKEPIRVYAGLQSADSAQQRADLVLGELERTGAFDRQVLVVATTTGMGFLDSRGTDPLEYLWNGDTAIAGVQYSYLPSWISILADQEAVVETSRTVFETVRQYWATLPGGGAAGAVPLRPLARVDRRRERADVDEHRQRAGRRRAHGRPPLRQRPPPPARGEPGVRVAGVAPRVRGGARRAVRGRAGSRAHAGEAGGRRGSSTCSTPRTPSCSSRATSPSNARLALGRPTGPGRLADDGLGPAGDDVAGTARRAVGGARADAATATCTRRAPTCWAGPRSPSPPGGTRRPSARISAALGAR